MISKLPLILFISWSIQLSASGQSTVDDAPPPYTVREANTESGIFYAVEKVDGREYKFLRFEESYFMTCNDIAWATTYYRGFLKKIFSELPEALRSIRELRDPLMNLSQIPNWQTYNILQRALGEDLTWEEVTAEKAQETFKVQPDELLFGFRM